MQNWMTLSVYISRKFSEGFLDGATKLDMLIRFDEAYDIAHENIDLLDTWAGNFMVLNILDAL